MKYLGEYKSYKLYETELQEREQIAGANSRYIRNTVLVFAPNDPHIKIGNEWSAYEKEQDARAAIDRTLDKTEKLPLRDRIKDAEEKSKEQEDAAQRSRENATMEDERRRRERRQNEYERERIK